ncbi:MAG: adenylyl-sulfate kinase [bacterium]|nr:MAG: adenylyl-sulfate kinase [bacterium]
MRDRNITPHNSLVTREDRRRLFGHGSCVVWMTGLSGSGKSTIAHEVERGLTQRGVHACVLDGDNVRHGLNADLGFSDEDRRENIRRIAEVARLMTEAGLVVITAFISPFGEDRDRARALFGPGEFLEVYVRCPMELCESRDPKGLYARARSGEIADFTGVDSPFEEPLKPDLILDTNRLSVAEASGRIMALLEDGGIVSAPPA